MAIDNALATQCLMPLFDMEPNETTGRVITVVLLVIQAALAIAATRIVGWVNSLSVGVEIGILFVLGIAFAIAVVVAGNGLDRQPVLRGVAAGDANYFAFGGGLMAAIADGPEHPRRLRDRREHGGGSRERHSHRASRDHRLGAGVRRRWDSSSSSC